VEPKQAEVPVGVYEERVRVSRQRRRRGRLDMFLNYVTKF